MAAGHREYSGLGSGSSVSRSSAAVESRGSRSPDPVAWALYLGTGSRRSKAAGRDSGVSVRSDGTKARDDMATVRIPEEQRTLTDQEEVTRYLATLGIDYERWPNSERVPDEASVEDVLAAYAPEIE